MPDYCELCGSGKHTRSGCNLARLADIMENPDNEAEQSDELAEEMERLYPGLWQHFDATQDK